LTGTDDREQMDAVCAEYQAGKGVRVEVVEPVVENAAPPEPIPDAPEPIVDIASEGSLSHAFNIAQKLEPPALLPMFEKAASADQNPQQRRTARSSDLAQLAFQF